MARLEAFTVCILAGFSLFTTRTVAGYIPNALEKQISRSSPRLAVQNIARRAGQNCTVEVMITKVLVLTPIHIQYYAHTNTTLRVSDYFTLNITNAPTSINSVYTGTSATLITQSNAMPPLPMAHVTHSSPSFTYVDSYSFKLSMTFMDQQSNPHLKKRQSTYVGGSGQASDSCTNAVVYSLVNGRLFANTSSGALQFGATTGTTYANFTASSNPGDISTAFSVDTSNNLIWSNSAFYNYLARFCVLPDNTIVAVFADPQLAPPNCVFVSLSMTRISSCVNAVGAPALSGPSGPSGPTGTNGATGATGPQGQQGVAGPTGPTGVQGIQGPSGATGVQGSPGVQGPSGPSGATGVQGVAGPTGIQGISGVQGPSGPSGATGVQGVAGATGVQGIPGVSGPSGPAGPIGATGATGVAGVTGATGVQGPKGDATIQFAYLGCWSQTCSSTTCPGIGGYYGFDSQTTTGGYNTTLTGSSTNNIDAQCAAICITKNGANFFGTVSAASGPTADCYCGAALTSLSSSAQANCAVCFGQSVGLCGKIGQNAIAVYARAF